MSNQLTNFEPFSDLIAIDPLRGIEDLLRGFHRPALLREEVPAIRLDIDENGDAYTVSAEIPGVKKDDIKVDVDGNRVSISAERKRETEDKQGSTVRNERYWGYQTRAFTLQSPVDGGKAEAHYEHGVLKLVLPKKAGTSGHRVAIR